MKRTKKIHKQAREELMRILDQAGTDSDILNSALRLLAKYRSVLIQNALVKLHGTVIQAGPFAGMNFIEQSAEGCHVPKLLGCYEEELHEFLNHLPAAGYDTVLNIGCAEGYYAVGIKRLLPSARVLAFDIDSEARASCEMVAAKNGMQIDVGCEFKQQDFAAYPGKVLVWCDIEGAELKLLDPVAAPALRGMDLVVELHSTTRGHALNVVVPRFSSTHEVNVIHARSHVPVLPPFLQQLGHLDQLLAQWEWRNLPTPWVVMRSKATRADSRKARKNKGSSSSWRRSPRTTSV